MAEFGPQRLADEMAKQEAVKPVKPGAIYGWLHGKSRPRYPRAELVVKILPKKLCITTADIMAAHEEDGAGDRRSAPRAAKAATTTKKGAVKAST